MELPPMEFSPDHAFDGPHGRVTLTDLFQGRRQLVLYQWWRPHDQYESSS